MKSRNINVKSKIYLLAIINLILIMLFIFLGLNESNFNYNISKRIPKIIAIIISGSSIAFSSLVFQTMTNNRILTPSILGLDSLYIFFQTVIVLMFGSSSIFMLNKNINFIFSTMLMIIGTLTLYKLVVLRKRNIFFLLLVGTVMGTLLKTSATFMQVIIDPNEFEALQTVLYASFNNVNINILFFSLIITVVIAGVVYDDIKKFDVMLLGRENAINLSINYDKLSYKIIIIVSILISVSTALVGPLTFLGILIVNLSYQWLKTYKHNLLIIGSILISILALVGGQFIVERILNYSSTVSIIINFIGGVYFIYLLLKESNI
ncbi:iron chelate uptake ABC transporter family permease subunit [Clostridium senegalense]|uniref:iron chelate uptake ABC transporter family permease subunit n=1 Tax=Clostridium senegalense TaxID=1465809 RepID=UPI00028969F5|nr:iron chelate uptake ABC transporter family permease subunit [Clostridium senegalense]